MSFGLFQPKKLAELSKRRGRREKSSNVSKFRAISTGDAGHSVALFTDLGSLTQLDEPRHQELKE